MVTKGDRTRAMILSKAAELVNSNGIDGMSMSDLMKATGLEKGGIYRHFASKEAIIDGVVDDYLAALRERISLQVSQEDTAIGRVEAIITALASVSSDPIVQGGCLLMSVSAVSIRQGSNSAKKVQTGMARLLELMRSEVEQAKAEGALTAQFNTDEFCTLALSAIQGSIILGEIDTRADYTTHVVNFLRRALAP